MLALKTMVVDDMATYRSIISRSLEQIDGTVVVAKLANGKKALEFLARHQVDLVTLDVEMPILDGLTTLKAMKQLKPEVDVIMVSGLSEQATGLTIKCLQLGALDFVAKPQANSFVENRDRLKQSLKNIIDGIHRRNRATRMGPHLQAPPVSGSAVGELRKKAGLNPKLVMIGISTGGPKALADVFEALDRPLPFPLLIVQHMPPRFTRSLAASLNRKSAVTVVEASHGQVLENNVALVAPGGYHMVLRRNQEGCLEVTLNLDPPVLSCRPSANLLFESAAPLFQPGELVALVMTGMGRDGVQGAAVLAERGAYIVSQSERSCTIYGMPKAIEESALQNEVLDLDQIGRFILELAAMAVPEP